MTRRSRRGGAHLDRLRSLDVEGLEPQRVPETVRAVDEPVKLAYCPLLAAHSDRSLCSVVDCRRCAFPRLEFEDIDTAWLCTKCAERARALPYWGDGKCEGCGYESSVLILCEVFDP